METEEKLPTPQEVTIVLQESNTPVVGGVVLTQPNQAQEHAQQQTHSQRHDEPQAERVNLRSVVSEIQLQIAVRAEMAARWYLSKKSRKNHAETNFADGLDDLRVLHQFGHLACPIDTATTESTPAPEVSSLASIASSCTCCLNAALCQKSSEVQPASSPTLETVLESRSPPISRRGRRQHACC
ncbi:hypothetical protein PC119_g82 [Phytophthora cactorum]|nr:hypothetical protein PC119_g82 [Phytophthora cactorum]